MKLESVVILALSSAALHGQTERRGSVSASGGLGVGGAQAQSSCGPAANANEAGEFSIALEAHCNLTVRAEGFVPWSQSAATLPVGDIRVVLNVNPLVQTVTVMESSPLVSASPEIAKAIDGRTLAELPSINRDINRFAMLDPRVRNTSSLGSDGLHGTRLTINGQLFRYTQYEIDGSSNYEPVLGNGPQQTLSIAAVAEYKVLLNQFGADHGRSAAGVVTAITKAGGDQWHGEAFYFGRPSGIQAAPPVSTFRMPNERQQFGGAIGGKLASRAHIFSSIEAGLQTRGSYIQSPTPSFYPGHQRQVFGLVNADYQPTDKQSLYLRLNANGTWNDNLNDIVGGFVQPSARQRDLGQNAGGQATHRWIGLGGVNQFRAALANSVPLAYYVESPRVRVARPNYSTEGASERTFTRVWSTQIGDVFSWEKGTHSLRAGGDFIRHKASDLRISDFGEYRFAAGVPQPGQQPIQYTQTFGQTPIRFGDTLTSAFVQDDWKVAPRLTLNLGLRHEYQSVGGDRNNFAPRIGLAWTLDSSGKTVVRAGAGLFYSQVFLQVVRNALQQGPASKAAAYTLTPTTPGFPVFPNNLTSVPTGEANSRDLFLVPSHFRTPYTAQFNVGIQRVLLNDWTLSVNAVFSQSQKLPRTFERNAPSPFVRTAAGQSRTAAAADASRAVRLWEGVGVRKVEELQSSGWARYAGFDAQMAKRFSRRFQAMGHYLYNSSMTNSFFTGGAGTGVPSEWSASSRDERGMTDFHQRHRLVAQGLFEAPLGFQFGTMLIAASGLPVNPVTGVDNNGDGNVIDRPVGLGRNSFRGPSQVAWDLSAMKRVAIRERLKLELRAEFLNALNRSNFPRVNATYGNAALPLATFRAPVAGVTNSDPARQIQFGARLVF